MHVQGRDIRIALQVAEDEKLEDSTTSHYMEEDPKESIAPKRKHNWPSIQPTPRKKHDWPSIGGGRTGS